jgi:3',5'-cyclic AMP phosphodiesterase CpdA
MWEHLNTLSDKPDLVLHGGDIIFSSFEKTRQRSQEQWDLYLRSMREHNKLPVHHCLGNHDIWGWNKKESQTTGNEEGWGKAWAIDLLGMPAPYYAFEARGVKFIVLDTVQPRGETGYEGGLGDAQFEWLQGELAGSKLPVVVLTHIPTIHASTLLVDARTNADNNWVTGGGSLLMDRTKVVNLISRHRNIAAVLSGHIHMDQQRRGVRQLVAKPAAKPRVFRQPSQRPDDAGTPRPRDAGVWVAGCVQRRLHRLGVCGVGLATDGVSGVGFAILSHGNARFAPSPAGTSEHAA